MAFTGIRSTILASTLAQNDMESKLDVSSRQLGAGQDTNSTSMDDAGERQAK
jgi:hypothetical protein